MISQDVDVLILESCGPKEVGRCATASHGLRTAARVAWKSLATRRFPLLTSIAHAASQLPDAKPFDYASAYHSHLHLRVSPPRLDDLEDLGDVVESFLPRIVVTYELCSRIIVSGDFQYKPFFKWSGRLSKQMPELWTSEQVPAELQCWWDKTEASVSGFRYPGSGPSNRPALRVYVTAASKTILLYSGDLNFAFESSLSPPRLCFVPEIAPDCPRFAEPSEDCSMLPEAISAECCMHIQPHLLIFDGRFELDWHLPDDVDAPDDTMLRYISNLDIDWLADPSSDYRGEDEDDYSSA